MPGTQTVGQFKMILKQLAEFRIANQEFIVVKKIGHLILNEKGSTGL